jgi:regulator of ribosome biosynthesis
MDSDGKKMRKPNAEESDLNVRKAVSFASRGRGGVALGRSLSRGGRGRGGGRGGRGGGRGGKGRR